MSEEESVARNFKNSLHELLGQNHLNAYSLAPLAGVPHQTIYRILSGNAAPTLVTAAKIAAALGVSLDSMITDS